MRHEEIPAAEDELVSVHSPDWTYRYVAPAAIELLGYRPQDLVGKWAYEIAHPEDVTRLILALRYARGVAVRDRLPGAPGRWASRLGRDLD